MVTSSLPCYCRDLVLFVGRLLAQRPLGAARVFASRCRVVVVLLLVVLTILFGTGKPMTGNYFFNYFQYQDFVGCVCMLNSWFSSFDGFCADNYNFSRFKLQDKCRNEKWELYLYGVMTIKVDRDSVEVLPWGVPPPRFSPNLATDHTPSMCCACLLSVALV